MVLFAKVSRSEKLLDIFLLQSSRPLRCERAWRRCSRGRGVFGAGHVGEKPAVEAASKSAVRSGTNSALGAKVKEF